LEGEWAGEIAIEKNPSVRNTLAAQDWLRAGKRAMCVSVR